MAAYAWDDLDVTSADEGNTDSAELWSSRFRHSGPPPEPPSTMTLVPMSIPFLTLPRELRDIIYRHLLSTKRTKDYSREPSRVSAFNFLRVSKLTADSGLGERRI